MAVPPVTTVLTVVGYTVAAVGLTGAVAVIAAHLWLKANRARLEHDLDVWDERAWQHKGKR